MSFTKVAGFQIADEFVLISGDTMTGFLTLNDDPVDPLHAVPKRYVDNNSQSVKFISPHLIPSYNNPSSILLPAGLTVKNSTDNFTLTLTSNEIIDLAVIGVNGLDTGSEAINTKYFVYIVGDSTNVNPSKGLFSINSNTPILPSGYDIYRRLNMWVFNNSSGNITPFYLFNWPYHTLVRYDVRSAYAAAPGVIANGDLNVLSAGNATIFTDISLSSFLPNICKRALINVITDHQGTGTSYYYLRPNGAVANGISVVASGGVLYPSLPMELDSNQIMEYQKYFDTGGGFDKIWIDVLGGWVTEIS